MITTNSKNTESIAEEKPAVKAGRKKRLSRSPHARGQPRV